MKRAQAEAARENGKKGGRPREIEGGEPLTTYSVGVPADLHEKLKQAGPKKVRTVLNEAFRE